MADMIKFKTSHT